MVLILSDIRRQATCGLKDFQENFPSPVYANLLCIDVIDSFRFAGGDALWVAVTEITLDGDALSAVKRRRPKRAGQNTGLTADAFGFVNDDFISFQVPVAGFGRAHLGTQGFFAILAGHRQIETCLVQFKDSNPGTAGVAGAVVKDGADHFAAQATGAFLLIDS
jgi:hypothetical protein